MDQAVEIQALVTDGSDSLCCVHGTLFSQSASLHLAPVVQMLDNATHWINHYPEDKY